MVGISASPSRYLLDMCAGYICELTTSLRLSLYFLQRRKNDSIYVQIHSEANRIGRYQILDAILPHIEQSGLQEFRLRRQSSVQDCTMVLVAFNLAVFICVQIIINRLFQFIYLLL